MGKNPTCNYATSVYSLFRNKLLLCYISIKIPCVELRERPTYTMDAIFKATICTLMQASI